MVKEIRVPTDLIFDIDIETATRKLLAYATKEHPDRRWVITALLWDDGDFLIEVMTSWNDRRHTTYSYHKSKDEYRRAVTLSAHDFELEWVQEAQILHL
jgi:hypothetical protein